MKTQFSRQFPRSLSLLVLPTLLAGMLLIGLLWLTSRTAEAQAGITIEMIGTTELSMDANGWCTTRPTQEGPDGSWYSIRVSNNSTRTYTGLELHITPAVSLTIDDDTRYLGNLEPDESVDLFIFVDYHQLRDWPGCANYDPPVIYDKPFTITLQSLSGGMTSTLTATDTFHAEGLTSALAGGTYRSHSFGPGFYVGQVFTMEVTYQFGNNPAGSPLFIQPTGNWDFLDQCFRLVGADVIASEVAGVTAGVTNTLWFSSTDTEPGDELTMLYSIEILCAEGPTESWPWSDITSGNDQKYDESGYGGDSIITITQPISGVIGVSKSVTPTVLPSGGVVTYTVRFQNVVTVPILVSIIDDALPPGVVYGGVTASSDVNLSNSTIYPAAGATGTLVWRGIPLVSYRVPPSGTVSAGVPGYIDLIYTATVTSTQGMYTNWLTGTVGKEPTDPINAMVWVAEMADLSLSKSSRPVPAVPGAAITYTLAVRNAGPSLVTAITLTDNLPATVLTPTYSASADNYVSATGAWTGLTLGAGDRVTLTIVGTLDAAFSGALQNTAVVTTSQAIDLDLSDNESTDLNRSAPMIEATKRDVLFIDAGGDGMPSPGDTLSYTIVMTNVGGSYATGVIFSDIPDVNTTLVTGTVQTSQGGVTSGNSPGDTSVTVNVGPILSGGSVTVSFQVTINNPLPLGVAKVTNQGLVMGDDFPAESTDDPDTPKEDDGTETSVMTTPDVEAYKSDALWIDTEGDGVVSPGDTLLYQVSVVNNGNGAAGGVLFSDLLADPNLALVIGTVWTDQGTVISGNNPGDTDVVVDVGTIPGGGGAVDISCQATIISPLPPGVTQVANQGWVTGDNFPSEPSDDPTSPEEDDSTETFVMTTPHVEVYKSDTLLVDAGGDGAVSPGDTLLYQVSIVNDGNGAAEGVLFSDLLANPNLTLVTGTVQTNLGTVTSGNNPGDTGVVVDMGAIPGGGSTVNISYWAVITSPLPPGATQVANQGLVIGDNIPAEPSDNPETPDEDDGTETTVEAVPDVEAYKNDALWIDANGDGVVSPGDTLLYQVSVANDGSGAAEGVFFSDLLNDPSLTLVTGTVQTSLGTVTSGNAPGDIDVVVDIGTIPGGGSAVDISYRAVIADPVPPGATQVTNQGLVTGDNFPVEPSDDPNTPEEDDDTEASVMVTPDVAVYKSDALWIDAGGDGVASPGDTLLYQVSIVNNGNGAAEGVLFSDPLADPNLALVTGTVQTSLGTVTSGNAPGDTDVIVDVGTIPGGGGAVNISYQATITSPLPPGVTQVANQGLVTGGNFPPEPSDDPETPGEDDDCETTVEAVPDVEVYKTDFLRVDADRNAVASPGDMLLYRITIINDGNGAAEGVVFTDVLTDPNLALVTGTVQTSLGTVISGNDIGDADVTVNIGAIPGGGGAVDISYQAAITDPFPLGVTQVANQGRVSGDNIPIEPSDDPHTPDEDDETETFVYAAICDPPADAYEPDNLYTQATQVPPGGTVMTHTFHVMADQDWLSFYAWVGQVYTITTSNLDADVDTVLQLYDVDGVTPLAENNDYITGSQASRIVWTAPANGWYFARTTHLDPIYDPCFSLICGNHYHVTVGGIYTPTDLTISKDAKVQLAANITFTIIVRNLGPAAADGAVMSDTVPSLITDVTWNCSAAGGASCGAGGTLNVITDTLISFPAGGVVTYTVNGLMPTWYYWENSATVTAPAGVTDINTNNNRASVCRYMWFMPLMFKNGTLPIP